MDATATGADEIGKAFQKVGGSAGALNLSFEKVASWIAVVSSRTREGADTIGQSIKSILARVQNLKEQGFTEDDGTKINDVAKALNSVGIQLVDKNGEFRNFGTVLDELGAKWSTLDSRQKAYLSTVIAGTYQQSRFLNLMEGYKDTIPLYEQALNAAGTTTQKFAQYQQGNEAAINRLKATMEGLWQNTFNSSTLRTGINLLTQIVSVANSVISTFGALPTLVFAVTLAIQTFTTNGLAPLYSWITKIPAAMNSAALSFTTLAEAEGIATAATITLRNALLAISRTILPVAIITGITYAVTELISKNQQLNAQQEAFKQQQELIANNWTTQKDKISSLLVEQSTLQETDRRYLEISNELAKLMPNLVQSIDDKGQAHLKSAEAIKKELDYSQKLSELENSRKVADAKSTYSKDLDDIKELQSQLDKINDKIKNRRVISGAHVETLSDADIESLRMQALGIEQQIASSTDKLKSDVSSLSASILNMTGIKFGDNVSSELDKIISKLDTSKLDANGFVVLTSNIANSIKTIQQVSTSSASSQSALAAYSTAVDTLKKNLNLTDDETKKFIDLISNTKQSLDNTKSSVIDYANAQKKLDDSINSTYKNMGDLASAYQKLQDGQQLSLEETLKLVDEYPQLTTYLIQHNGLITDKGAILQQVAEIERKTRLEETQNLLDSVTDTYNSLEAKRKLYEDFYKKINPFADLLENKYNPKQKSSTFTPNGFLDNSLTSGDQKALQDAIKQKEQLQLRVQLLSKPIDLSTFNGTGRSSSSSTSSFEDSTKYNITDPYERQLTSLDAKIKESQSIQNNYNDTQQEFRDELKKQIDLYHQKQDIVHQEADALRANNVELKAKLDTEKLTQKERDATLKQINDNENKITDLSATWFDLEKSATSANKAIQDSIQKVTDEAKKQQDELNKTRLDNAKSVAKDVIDAYKAAYQAQHDAEMAGIQASMDAEEKRHKQRTDDIDKEYRQYEDAINSISQSIDRQSATDDFNANLSKAQKESQDIFDQINQYKLDNSIEGQAKKKELEQQYADKQDEIQKLQSDRTKTLRKDSLQDLLDQKKRETDATKAAEGKKYNDTKDSLSKQKDEREKYWQGVINNDAKYQQIQDDIIAGHFDNIKGEMEGFKADIASKAQIIGKEIDDNIINKLTTAMTTMSNFSGNPFGSKDDNFTKQASSNGFYIPTSDNEKYYIGEMKGNSDKWKNDPSNRKSYEEANQILGKLIGAKYDNGTWYKSGLPLYYHNGGEVGVTGTSQGSWLQKILKSNEVPAILKRGEVVLNNVPNVLSSLTDNIMSNIMSAVSTRTLSANGSASNTYNFNFPNMTVTGGKSGADSLFAEIKKGMQTGRYL